MRHIHSSMNLIARKPSPLLRFITFLLIVASLQLAKEVFIVFASACLLTFLLNPIVRYLERIGVRRTFAVILTTIAIFSLLGGISYTLGNELRSLAIELPSYKENISERIDSFREFNKKGVLKDLTNTYEEIVTRAEAKENDDLSDEDKDAQAVRLVNPEPINKTMMQVVFTPMLSGLGMFGATMVLVIFLLIRQQDLRNRIMRLAGTSRLTATTRALDEAGSRMSRYLFAQTMINSVFGIALAVGLYFIGLPYVILFGCLAAVLRFIPYIGAWMSGLIPLTLSVAIFDTWQEPLLIVCLVASLELTTNMILEPIFYGQSIGVSEVALLVAITFWTWLWGPIGLLLATPMTVCFVVLCKYIPEWQFVDTLMSDKPLMNPSLVFYQRLLAMDEREAARVLKQEITRRPFSQVIDDTVIPALTITKREYNHGRLYDREVFNIAQSTRAIVEQLTRSKNLKNKLESTDDERPLVLARAFGDEIDELPLHMFSGLDASQSFRLVILSTHLLSSEIIQEIDKQRPSAFLISSLPPGKVSVAKMLAIRLRERFPELPIIFGHWTHDDTNIEGERLDIDAEGIPPVLVHSLTEATKATSRAVLMNGKQ